MSIFRDFGKASGGNAAPVTTGLVIAIVVVFLAIWTNMLTPAVVHQLEFDTANPFSKPWSLLTYPFTAGLYGPLGVFFICWILWSFGGAIERDLGPSKYLGVWVAASVLGALGVLLGSIILQIQGVSAGAWTCVVSLIVMWGTRNPTATVLFMFIIPIQGKWLAWLSAALLFFQIQPPQLAPFAAVPLLFAYLFAANKLPITYSPYDRRYTQTKKTERYGRKYYEEVRKREKDREERERLRKLFESNMQDGDK